MIKIVKSLDAIGAAGSEKILDDSGRPLIDILLDIEYFNPLYCEVYVNGTKISLPEFSEDGEVISPGDEEILTRGTTDESVHVVFLQKGIESLIFVAIGVLVGVAAFVLFSPDVPEGGSASSNNSYFNQSNSIRLNSAIPDIYGTVTSYPDLITSSPAMWYQDFLSTFMSGGNPINPSGLKGIAVTQFLCVGKGYYDQVSELRIGKSIAKDGFLASTTLFEPDGEGNTTVFDYIEHFPVESVSNIVVQSSDGVLFTAKGTSATTVGDAATGGYMRLISTDFQDIMDDINDAAFIVLDFNIMGKRPSDFEVGGTYYGEDFETYDYYLIPFDEVVVNRADFEIDDSGLNLTNQVIEVSPGYIIASSPSENEPSILFPDGGTETYASGPFDTERASNGLFIDLSFARGRTIRVKVDVEIQEIDKPGGVPVGAPETYKYSIPKADVRDVEKYTRKTLSIFIKESDERKFWRVRVYRTSPESNDIESPSEMTLERLVTYNKEREKVFKDVTVIKTVYEESNAAVNPGSDKINLDVRRRTISYDLDQGIVTYPLNGSEKFADAVLHEYHIVFGRDYSGLDLDSLYAIQESIDNEDPELGKFSYTFDDADMSLEDRITIICNCARVTSYEDGGVIRFIRNEARSKDEAFLITRKDLSEDRSKYGVNFNSRLPNDYDGVTVEYVDPDENALFRIYKSYDSEGNIVNVEGFNSKKITLTGCRNFTQAENRANLEVRIIGTPQSVITDTLTRVGNALDIGDLVLYSDPYISDVQSGDLKDVDFENMELSMSEPFVGDSGEYEMYFSNDMGELVGPISVQLEEGSNIAVYALDSEELITSNIYSRNYLRNQMGSRYVLSTTTDEDLDYYIISKKEPSSDGTVSVTMNSYTDSIFDFEEG